MIVRGKAWLSAPKATRYAIDGGGWLAGDGLFEVRYEISPILQNSHDCCSSLRISSFATDMDGSEYRLEQDLRTYDLYRMAVAEPLLLRSDEVRDTDFGGRARRTTETIVAADLQFDIDAREYRPVAVLRRPPPGAGLPTVTYFLFQEKYATGRFSLAWLRHEYAAAEPGAGPVDSLMLYMTLQGERSSLTATQAGVTPNRAAAEPVADDEVLASRLQVPTLIWRRWREPDGGAAPPPLVLTPTGRTGTPSTALSPVQV